MKNPSVVSFLFTLLLAAALCTHGREYVKDKDGKPVAIHQKYFIQPVKSAGNNGGGLVPAAINIRPVCPLGITQTILPYQPGLPVSFAFPHGLEETTIPTFSAVTIEFNSSIWPVCNEFSKFWKFDDSASAPKEPAILIGGNPKDKSSWFKIEEVGGEGANTYSLRTSRGTVGTTPGTWSPHLILTHDKAKTLVVKFVKVDAPPSASTSTSRVEKLGLRMFPFY